MHGPMIRGSITGFFLAAKKRKCDGVTMVQSINWDEVLLSQAHKTM